MAAIKKRARKKMLETTERKSNAEERFLKKRKKYEKE